MTCGMEKTEAAALKARVIRHVALARHFSKAETATLVHIIDRVNLVRDGEDGEAWPSQSTIAAATGWTLPAVKKAVSRLVEAGYLDAYQPARGMSNRYTVIWDRLEREANALESGILECPTSESGIPEYPRSETLECPRGGIPEYPQTPLREPSEEEPSSRNENSPSSKAEGPPSHVLAAAKRCEKIINRWGYPLSGFPKAIYREACERELAAPGGGETYLFEYYAKGEPKEVSEKDAVGDPRAFLASLEPVATGALQ